MKGSRNALGILLLLASGCPEEVPPPPAAAAPQHAGEHEPEQEAEPATPPPTLDEARAALTEQRYEDVCRYLETVEFSPPVCAFITDVARGTVTSLPAMDEWLDDLDVRQMSGVIVGARPNEENSYNVFVAGVGIILRTTTPLEPDALRFEQLWVQRDGLESQLMTDGAYHDVNVYREWPLHSLIAELAQPAEGNALAARALLGRLLENWDGSYLTVATGTHAPSEIQPIIPAYPFIGAWVPTTSPEIRLVFTDATYLYRFPYQGGVRRIHADIESVDTELGHITLRITEVTQNGHPVQFGAERSYLTYEMRGSRLYRHVETGGFYAGVENVPFSRIDNVDDDDL